MRRGCVAALGAIARSGHPDFGQLSSDWVLRPLKSNEFDHTVLLPDGPFHRYEDWDTPLADIVELFDSVLPLPDEPEAIPIWRRLGVEARTVLAGEAYRYRGYTANRLTLDGRDRWYRYWGGSAQTGNDELDRSVPATRECRRRQAVAWSHWVMEQLEIVHSMEVDADQRTFAAVERTVHAHFPEAAITRRRR